MKTEEALVLTGLILEDQDAFSLDEFCELCVVERQHVIELVEQGVIETHSMTEWRFGGEALRRARISLRLKKDLGVNSAGSALVLDLLDQIAALERQLRGR